MQETQILLLNLPPKFDRHYYVRIPYVCLWNSRIFLQ